MDEFPGFFQGVRLNFAENVLDQGRRGIALKVFSELSSPGTCQSVTWDELRRRVSRTADALQGSNVVEGDVIACRQSLATKRSVADVFRSRIKHIRCSCGITRCSRNRGNICLLGQ